MSGYAATPSDNSLKLLLMFVVFCYYVLVKKLWGHNDKCKNFPVIFSSPPLFLPLVSSALSLSLSLSLSFCLSPCLSLWLWAVTGCFQRKWCSPSGVVVNILSGERAFGRGHMKTSYALNPQQNPGVRYNGENHFGGKCLERQQSCGKCFRDNHKTTLFSSG